MRENTPPRRPDFENDDDDEILEEIELDNEPPMDDDDELEMEEITLAELEARLGIGQDAEGGMEEDNEDEIRDRERIEAIRDDAICTFSKHTSPVFGCSLHPKFDWAVTGSEDDHAYVWDTRTGEVLYEINEHKDTVTETHFSYDGSYLATGDIAGEIYVYKVSEQHDERPILSKVWEYSMSDMAWLFWHRGANVLLAGADSGEVYVWRIPSGDCKILPGESARCEVGELSGDGKKLLTAYSSGVVKLWDLKTCQVLMEVNQQHPLGFADITHVVVACERDSPFYVCAEGGGKLSMCSGCSLDRIKVLFLAQARCCLAPTMVQSMWYSRSMASSVLALRPPRRS